MTRTKVHQGQFPRASEFPHLAVADALVASVAVCHQLARRGWGG